MIYMTLSTAIKATVETVAFFLKTFIQEGREKQRCVWCRAEIQTGYGCEACMEKSRKRIENYYEETSV